MELSPRPLKWTLYYRPQPVSPPHFPHVDHGVSEKANSQDHLRVKEVSAKHVTGDLESHSVRQWKTIIDTQMSGPLDCTVRTSSNQGRPVLSEKGKD